MSRDRSFKTSSAAAPACERQRTHFRSARFCSARLSPQEGRAAAPEHTNSGGSAPRISNVDQETVRPRVWMGRGGWDTTGRPLSPGGREAPWTIIVRVDSRRQITVSLRRFGPMLPIRRGRSNAGAGLLQEILEEEIGANETLNKLALATSNAEALGESNGNGTEETNGSGN